MKEQEIKNIISDAIDNAIKLKWIKNEGMELYMHIADVEKIIYGIFDESYIERLKQVKEDIETEEENTNVEESELK